SPVTMGEQMRAQVVGRQPMDLAHEFHEQISIGRARLARPSSVNLNPIARADDARFAAVADAYLLQRRRQRGIAERDALAHVHRRGTKTASQREEVHGPPPCTTECEAASVQTSKANATMVSKATRRARR